MNKKYVMFFLCIAIIVISLSVGYQSRAFYEDEEFYYSRFGKISKVEWSSIDIENSGYSSAKALLSDVDKYVAEVAQLVDRKDWKEQYTEKHGEDFETLIDFEITYGPSQVFGAADSYKYLIPKVKLTKSRVDNNESPLIHEITHILTPFYSSRSLREGLASYSQAKLGSETEEAYKNEMDLVMKRSKAALFEKTSDASKLIVSSIGKPGIPTGIDISIANLENRWDYYTLSHSFSYYIIKQYGMSNFMSLYESADIEKECELIIGKKIETLKSDWIEYVKSY